MYRGAGGTFQPSSGSKIGQGKENVKKYLRENPEVSAEVENLVREKLGIATSKKAKEKSSEEKARKTKSSS